MHRKQIRFIGYCLTIGAIAILTLGVLSCSSKSRSVTTTEATTTTPSTTTTATTTTLSSIAVAPASPDNSAKLAIGSTQQFNATGTYADGSTADISSSVTWNSDTMSVATIDSDGEATGVAAGKTEIMASLSGITSPAVTLTVISYSAIVTTPAMPKDLAVGLPEQFTAIGTYANGSSSDITSQVTWTSSDTAIAKISSTGLATGVAAGTANITAALSGVTGSPISLTVIAAVSTSTSASKLSSIAITPTSPGVSVDIGSNVQFTATGTYADGSTADISSQVAWTSADNTIATIDSDGLATGVAAGYTNITATLSGITSPSVTVMAMVPMPALSAIAITPVAPDNSSHLAIGSTQRFIATGTYADGSTANISSVVTWTSSKTAIATIDTDGLAQGVAAGNTDISAYRLGVTSPAVILTVVGTAPTATGGS